MDKSLGMKLHAKWDGPYKLTRILKSGVSGNLEDGWVSLAKGLKAEDHYMGGEVRL